MKSDEVSSGQCVDQGFFLFFGEGGEGIKRGSVTRDCRGGEKRKYFRGKPRIAGPAAHKEDGGADTAQKNLRAKTDDRGHAGLALAAHLAEIELARKGQRGPVGDG